MPLTNPGMPGMITPGQISSGRYGAPRSFPQVYRPPAAPVRQGPPPAPAFRPPIPVRPPSTYAAPNYGPPRVQPANYGPPNPPSRTFGGSSTANPNLPLDPRALPYSLFNSGIYTPAAQDLYRNRVVYTNTGPGGESRTRGIYLNALGYGRVAVQYPGSTPGYLTHELGHVQADLAGGMRPPRFSLSDPFRERLSFEEAANRAGQPNVNIPGSYLNDPFPGMFGNPRGTWGGPEEYYSELAAYPYAIPPELRSYYPQFNQSAYNTP